MKKYNIYSFRSLMMTKTFSIAGKNPPALTSTTISGNWIPASFKIPPSKKNKPGFGPI